ncbi:ABC transporter permease [Saccharopolyspora karakumensis]|uniref:ABC transporter permease n=1 Tax=Saccharopolyspora karakumensis TaxID=2530386 RepID=A0A4V2YY60_9PSEU|nr:ABC transporter permease [Saccharopolyspora karakumensis]TDD91957.1 ABC transporter permease [Saccharopolyspora karakumensis]
MTAAKSAYPVPVEELLPQARQLVMQLGRTPSRNQLMAEFRIGAPKAREILDRLAEEHPAKAPNPAGLHVVTEPAPTETEPTETHENEPAEVESETADVEPVAESEPVSAEESEPVREVESEPITTAADPAKPAEESRPGPVAVWPVMLLALPAFVAIWSGWVGLGQLTGFGIVHPLPGIADGFAINTAITLPIGVETYAAYALRVWLSGQVPARARRFAKYSALGSLALGALGQIAFHLMKAAGMTSAPWLITAAVACLPVAVLGMGASLAHLIKDTNDHREVQR